MNVRQVSSYSQLSAATGTENVLVQSNGLGGPYQTLTTAALVATALASGSLPLDIGNTVNANAIQLPNAGTIKWNGTGILEFDAATGLNISYAPGPSILNLSPSGALKLTNGTLTVARDPAAALEVATMQWVGANTVASFNARNGAVTLWPSDIYNALGLNSPIATEAYVTQAITAAFQSWLMTCPVVTRWNGRVGSVYLMLSDITTVFFQPGQQPITPTPPLTSNDNSIANTQWVVEYLTNELAGGGTNFATQAWVLANTVNSFNGRMGPVTLTLADVTNVGGAPINTPNFSGIPTAPTAAVGQATGQIATTAFVQQAITANTAGVSTFNTRTGDVTLTAADIAGAGGLANPSPNLTGNPTAPTQAPGTSTPVIANCEFVTSAINAAVTSFNTRTGAVTLLLSDITSVGGAPLANPTFTGVPAAPTANAGTNTTQIATTAFVTAALSVAGGVSSFNSRTGAVDLEANDISAAGGLVNPSVGLTGTPTAPTATAGTNTNQIATTAFVITTIGSSAVSSFNTRTGAVVLSAADITGAGGAPLANPTFTGTPQAPTAAPGTNSTQLATTAYVTAAIAADTTGVTSFNTRTGAVTLSATDITGAGGALLASPVFTGVPAGPTATPGTSTTQLATTAFVSAAIAASGVTSFNGRSGAVTLIANDISAANGALIASPTFTGTPAGPTAAPGTNTTQLATCAFVTAAAGAYLPTAGGAMTGNINYANNVGPAFNLTPAGTYLAAGIAARIQMNGPTNPTTLMVQLAAAGAAGATPAWLNVVQLSSTGAAVAGGLSVSASATVGGTLGVTGNVTAPDYYLSSPSTAYWGTFGGSPALVFAANNYMSWSNSALTFFMNAAQVMQISGGTGLPVIVSGQGIRYAIYSGNNVAFGWNGSNSSLGLFIDNNSIGVVQVVASDATLKENLAPISVDCLAVIDQVQLQQFDWIPTPVQPARPHISCGFTAQNVQSLIPDAVPSAPVNQPLSVDLMTLLAYAFGAIQQLSARLTALDGKAA